VILIKMVCTDSAVTLFPSDLEVLLGDGTGTFNVFGQFKVGNPSDEAGAPVAADFNRDGYPDIAVPLSLSNTVSVLINAGNSP
jgi:hypothetical protein